MTMEEQRKFTWDIHYACNYRCPYCWFDGKWHQLSKQNKYMLPDELEFIKELSQMHNIGITTNLSVSVDGFVKQVDASRVEITPTFHPLFADLDKFTKNVLLLRESGMLSHIFYLAYPPQVKLIKYYSDKFKSINMPIAVLTFWGGYNGKNYPQSYTREEKKLIEPFLGNVGGEKLQLEPKQVMGKLCRAGQVYANIKAGGSVFRCGGNYPQPIGNLFSDSFKLLDGPLPCKCEVCPCNEWAFFLVNGKDTARETQSTKVKELINRSSIRPNRVFITWDIHYGCNYNCSYCNTPKPWNPPGSWDRDRDKVVYLEAARWLKIWEDIYNKYGSCEIHITGGEPFTYPSFLELITGLSKIHTLEIITNLSSGVSDIIRSVTPDRVRIGTTFHPEFADLNEFLKKHIILRKHGFETWANYVAYPPQMNEMANYKKEFDKLKISFNMQPFMGKFEGREYPAGYTDSELSYLKGCYDNDDIINKKTIEWKTGTEYKTTESKSCRMGQMYAKVYPIGDAYRCCANGSRKLGNLIDGTFELLDEAAPCECKQCYCWRCMLVENEKNWSPHWVIPEKKNYENVNV
jgi:hypothetical protein